MVRPIKSKSRRKNSASAQSLKVMTALKKTFIFSMPYILSLTAIGVLFGSVIAYALSSPTFQLSEVRILNGGTLSVDQSFKFAELQRGENLISLDLVGVQQVIKRKHPEFKEVYVRRVLPNRVEVMLKRRTPVAQVAFSRFVQIDKDLVILPGSSTQPFKNLTILEGAPVPRKGLMVGTQLSDLNTQKVIKLAELIKRTQVLRKHFLSKVDMGDPKNIVLVVDQNIEIRIGGDHFLDRIKILDQTLKTVALDSARIQYIDLRFDDVVIGPR